LRYEIKELESKPNRTPKEEQELADLKDKIKKLEQENKNNNSPSSYVPYLVGGCFLVVFLLLAVVIFKKNRKTH
jgi:hypothetical protein